MEALPRETLKEITKCLSLSSAACWAQTSKLFNTMIWSLITTLDEHDTKRIEETTILAKFDNLESLLFGSSAKQIPKDLIKLTTLQKLKVNEAKSTEIKESLSVLQSLKNLQELFVSYKNGSSKKLDELLTDHTRLTKLSISSHDLQEFDPFTWKLATRLRYLKLSSSSSEYIKFSSGFFSTLWTLTQLRGLGLSNIILDQLNPETGLSKLCNLEELQIVGLRDELLGKWTLDYNELLDLKKLTALDIMDVNLNQKLIDIIIKMTQLITFDLYEPEGDHKLSPYSTLKNLTRIWIAHGILESDPGLAFSQMPNLEIVSIPWCQNVTQLGRLKKLRELFLLDGSPVYPQNDQNVDFLNELETVKELNISAIVLPNDGIVNMKGMTNLTDLDISTWMYNFEKNKTKLPKFLQGLSQVPSLVSLGFSGEIIQELLPIIATSLTQLKLLKLPKKGRSLVKDALPSLKGFTFEVKFREF